MGTLSQTVAPLVRVYEADVTMPTSSGTVEAISIPGDCVVIGAAAKVTEASAGATAHTFDVSIGSSDIQSALDFFAASLGDILTEAPVPVGATADDTVDIVSTVTGTGTAGTIRLKVWVIDMEAAGAADEVARDQLA